MVVFSADGKAGSSVQSVQKITSGLSSMPTQTYIELSILLSLIWLINIINTLVFIQFFIDIVDTRVTPFPTFF